MDDDLVFDGAIDDDTKGCSRRVGGYGGLCGTRYMQRLSLDLMRRVGCCHSLYDKRQRGISAEYGRRLPVLTNHEPLVASW
jgi:hypothetical protein